MMSFLVALINLGWLNPVYSYAIVSVLIILVFQLFRFGTVRLNMVRAPLLWFLLLFGAGYSTIGVQTISSLLMHTAVPFLTMCAGWVLYEMGRDRQKNMIRLLIAVAVGFAVHASLNYFVNVGRSRFMLRDFFSGMSEAATGLGAVNTYVVSLIGYWIFVEKRLAVKLIALACSIPTLLSLLLLGTRTQMIILISMTALTLLIYTFERHGKTALVRVAAILAVLALAAMAVYQNNLFGIRTTIDASTLLMRLQDTSVGQLRSDAYRINSVWNGIVSLIENPLGHVDHNYFHNMWLDIGRVGGWIPFIGIMVFSVVVLFHLVKIMKSPWLRTELRYLLFCLIIGAMINFLAEPIIEGMVDFFYSHVLIVGMMEAMYHDRSLRRMKTKEQAGA